MNPLTRLIAAGLASSLAITSAVANTVYVQVTGSLIDATCTITGGDLGGTVTLPTLPLEKANSGSATDYGHTPFSIQLSNCAAGVSTAVFSFDGAAHPLDAQLWASNGTAQNVALALKRTTPDEVIRPISSGGSEHRVAINGYAARINGVATYHPVGLVTPGSFGAIATVTVRYE